MRDSELHAWLVLGINLTTLSCSIMYNLGIFKSMDNLKKNTKYGKNIKLTLAMGQSLTGAK